MRKARFEHLLAGTAIVLALAVSPYSSTALAGNDDAVSAAVPMPETADVPPPTAADVTSTSPKAEPEAPAHAAATAESAKSAPAAVIEATPEILAPQPATAAAEAAPAPASPSTTTAAAPAATPDVTSAVPASPQYSTASSTDGALIDKLRDGLASGKFDRVLGGKKDRASVEQFYASRDFAPLWVVDGALSARGKAAAAYLAGVAADGLDPADYPLPEIKAGLEPDALAEAEIRFTDVVLTYAHHAMDGRVHYSRVSGDIIYDLAKVDPADILGKLAKAEDVGSTLDSFEPQNPYYRALKAKLAEVRHAPGAAPKAEDKQQDLVHVPDGKMLRPGMSDPRVIALRKRLDVDGDKNNPLYDNAVVEAVKAFQTESDISVDGMLGPNTVRVLNGQRPVAHRLAGDPADIIIANMERWRWVPRDLGKSYVMVNIPDYTLRVVHDGKVVWKTKVVVGQPGKPTPLLSAEMKYITVNPTWNVPPSIIQNEYLPALQQDPQAMDRIGLKVEQNPDGTVRIWQPPGDRNALGRIRFNFPNKFLVYQHDTPDKYLFAKDKRAYSHGCMRVENPLKYGEVLLGLVMPEEHYTAERLQKMFGGSEVNINFPHFIPDHLTYQTAFVDDDGKLQLRDDVYGRDAKLLAILKGSERKVADIPVERAKSGSVASVKMPPGSFGSSGGGFFGGGTSFFDRLFGSPEPAPRPRNRVGRAAERRASTH